MNAIEIWQHCTVHAAHRVPIRDNTAHSKPILMTVTYRIFCSQREIYELLNVIFEVLKFDNIAKQNYHNTIIRRADIDI